MLNVYCSMLQLFQMQVVPGYVGPFSYCSMSLLFYACWSRFQLLQAPIDHCLNCSMLKVFHRSDVPRFFVQCFCCSMVPVVSSLCVHFISLLFRQQHSSFPHSLVLFPYMSCVISILLFGKYAITHFHLNSTDPTNLFSTMNFTCL